MEGTTHAPWVYQELDQVSQIVATGTISPPVRWAYGYENVQIGGGGQRSPFLHTITVPSPTGTGTSTTTINYEAITCFVSSIVDGNGNTREYAEVNANHTQVTIKDPLGSTVYAYTAGWDNNMSVTTVTDGAGNVVQTEAYSDPNNPYGASSVMDGNGRTTSMTWDQYGNALQTTSPRGTVTTTTENYTQWPMGRVSSVQTGTKTPMSSTYYEPSGLLASVSEPIPGTVGGGTVTSTFTYNSLGSIQTITAPGNNAAATITTTMGYTTDGGYSQTAAVGQPLTITDNLGKSTHFRYDVRGNTIARWDALGNQVDWSYNLADQPVQIQYHPTGQTGVGRSTLTYTYLYVGGPLMSERTYDESGTLVRQIDSAYGAEGEFLQETGSTEPMAQTYDALYRLKTLSDGRSSVTTYSYNQAGYLAAIGYPGADSVTFPLYDAAGDVLRRIDGRSIQTDYVYGDAGGHLSQIQYPATPALNVALTYNAYGRRATMTDGTGSHSWTYDDRDEVTSATTTYTGLPARTLTYSFYADGSRAGMGTLAGNFAYNYDAVGRMAALSNPYSEVSSWTYLDNSWLASQTLGNAAATTYTYNPLGQLTDLTNRTGGGGLLSQYGSMLHNGAGGRVALTAALPAAPSFGGLTAYQYDTKDQLTQEQSARSGGYTSSFGYDAAGNATTWKGAAKSYNTNNQDTANSYDGNGNPTVYQGVGASYDPENRLTAVGATLTAGYTGDGLRAWKQNSTGTTYFVYDGDMPVLEMDGAGNVTAVNTWGANGVLSRRTGAASVFYTFDPQGSVAQRLDAGGSVLTSFMFDAHGVGLSSSPTNDPYAYKGQWGYYTDTETGLLLLTHRYYDPGSGRFLTRDPISYEGGVNVYAYCTNDPVDWSDPEGLASATWLDAHQKCANLWGIDEKSEPAAWQVLGYLACMAIEVPKPPRKKPKCKPNPPRKTGPKPRGPGPRNPFPKSKGPKTGWGRGSRFGRGHYALIIGEPILQYGTGVIGGYRDRVNEHLRDIDE